MATEKRSRPAHLMPVPDSAQESMTFRGALLKRRAEIADAEEYARHEILPRIAAQVAVLREPAGLLLYERCNGQMQLKKPSELRALFAQVSDWPPQIRMHPLDWYLRQEGRREVSRIVFEPAGARDDEYNLCAGLRSSRNRDPARAFVS